MQTNFVGFFHARCLNFLFYKKKLAACILHDCMHIITREHTVFNGGDKKAWEKLSQKESAFKILMPTLRGLDGSEVNALVVRLRRSTKVVSSSLERIKIIDL